MVIVLMGVSGSGKTTIGIRLAARFGWRFYEGDDFHSPQNKERMRGLVPLTDPDRQPWLAALAGLIRRSLAEGQPAVLACSALKRRYRDLLRAGDRRVRIVYLRGSYASILSRMQQRYHEYMTPAMLPSQWEALEEPDEAEKALVVDTDRRTPEEVVEEIMTTLGLREA